MAPGVDMKKKWRPELRRLIDGAQCPLCKKSTSSVGNYLNNLGSTGQPFLRTLYYIAFKHEDRIFYKIGVAPEKTGVRGRYSPSDLLNDNVSILWYKEVLLDNALALLLEATTLSFFDKERWFALHILKHCAGGTECFSSNIIQEINFKHLIEYGIKNFQPIANDDSIYDRQIKDCSVDDIYLHINSLSNTAPKTMIKPDHWHETNNASRSVADCSAIHT
jgi:hypothetical protein